VGGIQGGLCLFCKIVAGTIPATVVAKSTHSLAFRDIEPQAPTHVLVIPRRHVGNVADLAHDPQELADLFRLAGQVAEDEGLDRGYRMCSGRETRSSRRSSGAFLRSMSTCAATSSMRGPSADIALVERLLDELLIVIEAGQPLNRDAVSAPSMLRAQTKERPADVLTLNIVSNRGARSGPRRSGRSDTSTRSTRTPSSSASARRAPARPISPWPRPSPRCRPSGSTGSSSPARRRGRRAARLPARHPQRQDRPLSAAALRRPARHGRPRVDPAAHGRRAPSRSRRWPTCAAAPSTTPSSSSTRRRTPRPSR
jgi:hypothetical protein